MKNIIKSRFFKDFFFNVQLWRHSCFFLFKPCLIQLSRQQTTTTNETKRKKTLLLSIPFMLKILRFFSDGGVLLLSDHMSNVKCHVTVFGYYCWYSLIMMITPAKKKIQILFTYMFLMIGFLFSSGILCVDISFLFVFLSFQNEKRLIGFVCE